MDRKITWVYVVATFIFLLSSCGLQDDELESEKIIKTNYPVITKEAIPSLTSTVTPKLPTKKNTPTPTRSLIASTSSPPSSPPTWTPSPILVGKEKEEWIIDLYENNAGCDLPCWWGVVPGTTSWDQASHIVEPIAYKIGEGFLIPQPIDGQKGRVTAFYTKYELLYSNKVSEVNFFITDGPIYRILVSPYGTEISYQLNQLLTEYGTPEEVWVQGWPYNDDRIPHYAILVMYPSKGIMARYQGDAILAPDFEMLLCPGTQGPELNLWDPGREDAKEFAHSLIEQQNHRWLAPPFMALEEATGIDIDNFYQKMLDPEGCILTPQNIWDDQE